MSLATNITNLATRIATENKALRTLINGNVAGLTSLTTTNKTNLVAAINEVKAAVGGAGATINDTTPSLSTVYSSTKTDANISAAVSALVAASPATLDTLNELAAALGNDAAFATTTATALGNRVRFDAIQTLTAPQQAQARSNMGAGTSSLVIGTASGEAADAALNITNLALKAPLASPAFTGTPTGITKTHVGLPNVDNTSDAAKPVSTAQQTALNLKANLASPTFTGTVLGITKAMVGLTNVDDTSDASKPVSTAQAAAIALKANLASPTFTGTVGGITKAMVGLGSVDNTTDLAKPVSTATQTALDLKASNLDMGDPNTNFVTTFEAGLI